jgi:hypothetical protein
MFQDIEENRYPFDNFSQFLSGGYWLQLEALHLLLGWLFVCLLSFFVLRRKSIALQFRFATLYFVFAVFTNPAYDFVGLKINEIFGLITIILMLLFRRSNGPTLQSASVVIVGLLVLFTTSVLHNLLVVAIYPALNPDIATLVIRAAVNIKILVLACNLMVIGHGIRRDAPLDVLIKPLVLAGTFALTMYLLQAAVLLSGTVPFGTYLDAGYIGIPAFGSVSIERGHFGKFMAPLFPFSSD